MPLEQLLAMYGYQIAQGGSPAGGEGVPSHPEAELTEHVMMGDRSVDEDGLQVQGAHVPLVTVTDHCTVHLALGCCWSWL